MEFQKFQSAEQSFEVVFLQYYLPIDQFHCFEQSVAIAVAAVIRHQGGLTGRKHFAIDTNLVHGMKIK